MRLYGTMNVRFGEVAGQNLATWLMLALGRPFHSWYAAYAKRCACSIRKLLLVEHLRCALRERPVFHCGFSLLLPLAESHNARIFLLSLFRPPNPRWALPLSPDNR